MRTAVPVLLSSLIAFFAACRQSGEGADHLRPTESSPSGRQSSLQLFSDAEQKLAMGEYSFAAAQLHKGIIAYRTETGKMRGPQATQANRAIDALTRMRKNLREGKPVSSAELHLVIENALAVEGRPGPSRAPGQEKDLAVPVGGH